MTKRVLEIFTGYVSTPILSLRGYRLKDLPRDLLAGITVSVVDLPQSMAFAVIAGISPIYGIYTAVIQAMLGGLFTSSAFLSNGPTNTQSLLVAAIVTRLAHQGTTYYLTLVIGLTLIKGIIQLAFAAARMGALVRYVSNSVMIGFTAGAGVLIVAEQVPNFLGVTVQENPHRLPGLAGAFQKVWPHIHQINPYAVGIGVGCLAAVLILRRVSRLIPGPLIVVAGAAALVFVTGWQHDGVHIVQHLPTGFSSLPHFVLPHMSISDAETLLGGALALALLGMLESVSIAKSIAIKSGDRIDANQEFFGQGLSNVVGSFFQCMPGSGSFSRSALQYEAGAKTRMCSVVQSLANALIFIALAAPARFIPYPSLAAILFVIGASLIDWKNIKRIFFTSRIDAAVCLLTFVSALTVPLTYAIYVGIFLNLALYLRQAGQLHMVQMIRTPAGPFAEQPLSEGLAHPQPVVFLQVEGNLFFAVADELQDRLTEVAANPDVRVVVLRLKRTHSIDATVLSELDQFLDRMKASGRHLVLCGVRDALLKKLEPFGLIDKIGRENVFHTSYGVFASAKRALQRAWELAGVKGEYIARGDQLDAWTYEI